MGGEAEGSMESLPKSLSYLRWGAKRILEILACRGLNVPTAVCTLRYTICLPSASFAPLRATSEKSEHHAEAQSTQRGTGDRLKAGLQRGDQFFDNWVVRDEKVPLRGCAMV